MKNAPIPLIATTAAAGTITSPGVYIANVYVYSLHGYWGSGGTGSIVVQVSNDDVPVASSGTNPSANVVNWTPVDSGTLAVSGAGNIMANFNGVGYSWVRSVYTAVGGTAAMNLNYFGKGS